MNARGADAGFEFTQAEIAQLHAVYAGMENDHERLLRFIDGPDVYMAENIPQSHFSSGLHFHVQHDGLTLPSDTSTPDLQLIFTSTVNVKRELLPVVSAAIKKKQLEDLARGGGAYCGGCRRCAIVKIKEFDIDPHA